MEIVAALSELGKVVAYVRANIKDDAIIFLKGDLASGKTTLVQAIASSYGLDSDVTSPTFTLQHCYGDKLYHYDLYRLEHGEFMELGLFEEFDRAGWHMIEWGSDELREILLGVGYDLFIIEITHETKKRKYTIEQLNA